MKKTVSYEINGKNVEREVNYIPVRYIIAVLITLFEVLAVIGIVIALCYYVPYFYIAAYLTEIFCVIRIIASDDNPDYKVPWLLFVLIIPIAGFMLYFMFYSRKLQRKFVRRLTEIKSSSYKQDDTDLFDDLKSDNESAYTQAKMLTNIAETHLFTNTKQEYFPLGEEMFSRLVADLKTAEKFIYMEYFIIEEGKFWNTILDVLKEKAVAGVDVKVTYDDIGCMMTLPGDYHKTLKSYDIKATPFSRLRGNADSEFNNRSHRKITVIDGKVGYTGGVNIADEYINEIEKYGHWKDTAIRLEGEAVWELTKLFLIDFGINVKKSPVISSDLFPKQDISENGYVIPFGDGPHPLYERRVGKSVIQNMLNHATRYVYMTSPYLIIDNDLCTSIENAALRGVDVRIIVPHIPDKKIIFGMTQSFYPRLMAAGVKIYEYTPGFIHAKSYLADDKTAMIGTINLDYRSLVHHFENGVWMYGCESIKDLKRDISDTLTLETDCLYKKGADDIIRIRQMKTSTYEKPISTELATLIKKAIAYTQERYGETQYVFVDEKNPSKPMQYATVHSRVIKMIHDKDLRDDHGEHFGFTTHMYRHYYGAKLTEMHLDDWTIAKLLGHTSLRNVKYYRKMSNQMLADDTRRARKTISEFILNNLDGWEDEYEQIRQDGSL